MLHVSYYVLHIIRQGIISRNWGVIDYSDSIIQLISGLKFYLRISCFVYYSFGAVDHTYFSGVIKCHLKNNKLHTLINEAEQVAELKGPGIILPS